MIFDPLNLMIPISLAFKIQLQQLWLKNFDWDSPLRDEVVGTYIENIERLESATSINVKRNYGIENGLGSRVRAELHVFCDASWAAYGCVAYARNVYDDSKATVTLIMAKGRVALLKGELSIHRLELIGAITAVRTTKICKTSRREFDSTHYYCDNTCVLAWIRDKPERWKNFVATESKKYKRTRDQEMFRKMEKFRGNRIKEIQENSRASQVRVL